MIKKKPKKKNIHLLINEVKIIKKNLKKNQ